MYFVYIICSKITRKRYIGQTNNLERRLNEHNIRQNRFTSGKGPWEVVYQESFETRTEAMRREKFFKSGKGREFLKNILAS